MSSSESSRSPSPSPPPPPPLSPSSPSYFQHGPPNLERLVTHFVAAKRSLNSTSHVYRANELVTSSRALIEEIALLHAKNAFAAKGLEAQVDTLDAIRDALVEDADGVADDFHTTLADLDKAHCRLDRTLQSLRRTVVAAGRDQQHESPPLPTESRSGSSISDDGAETDPPKTLFDFIDETTHENLITALRSLIDSYHTARGDLDTNTLQTFEKSLKAISEKLAGNMHGSLSSPSQKATIYDEPPPTVAELFHNMESHATQMASLLGNLIEHHDKCVDALKHTEGGGEAAKMAIQSEELTKHPPPGVEESLYGKTAADPISEQERTEMLDVVESDAPQVEDVVIEIKDYASEMEGFYSQLMTEVRHVRSRNRTLKGVLTAMKTVRAAVPRHVDAASRFREQWREIREEMQSKTTEVAGLSVFYEQFLSGYGKLLREVERRKATEAQMKKMAEKARRELDRLYEADTAARQDFMEDFSDFIPSDLAAWHGLEDAAPRWEIKLVEADDATRLPDG